MKVLCKTFLQFILASYFLVKGYCQKSASKILKKLTTGLQHLLVKFCPIYYAAEQYPNDALRDG